MTLSAWIKVDSLSHLSWSDCIISKGTTSRGYLLARANGKDSFSFKVSTTKTIDYAADGTSDLDADSDYHYITGVQTSDTIIYYFDGKEEARKYQPYQLEINDDKLHIGNIISLDESTLLGRIDEVRVINSARSSDWIKFSYENQKPNSAILTWK